MSNEPANAYAPPASDIASPHEDDVSAVTPTATTRYASGFAFAAGATAIATALQTMGALSGATTLTLVSALVLAALGVALFISGGGIMRLRAIGALGGAISGTALTLASAAWLVVSFGGGYFTLFALVLPPLSGMAALLSWLSIGPTRRADSYRAQLLAI